MTWSRTRSPSPWSRTASPSPTPRPGSSSTASRGPSAGRAAVRVPRGPGQALDRVLELVVEEEKLVTRLSGRRMLVDGQMVQRDDDKPETVRHRLEVYREQTAPLSGVLRGRGLLSRIDAIGSVEEVTARALAAPGVDPEDLDPSAAPTGASGRPASDGERREALLARVPLLAKWSGRMIQIKTAQELELMRASGLVTAGALAAVKAAVRPGVTTGELDAIAADHIRSRGRGVELPRLPRVHRHHLRVDQRRGGARHPGPRPGRSPRATTSPSTAARSCRAGTATPPSP